MVNANKKIDIVGFLSSAKFVYPLAIVIIFLLSLVLFASSMTKSTSRDEQMYVTAGVLLSQGKMIYKDFAYISQLPFHPLIYAAIFKLFNTTHFLMTSRCFSVLCDIFSIIAIIAIYRRIFSPQKTQGILLGLAGAVLFVFNPIVDFALGRAWNHDLIIACCLASFWIFITIDFNSKKRFLKIALIAVLLNIATFSRITTAFIEILFLIFILISAARPLKKRFKDAITTFFNLS